MNFGNEMSTSRWGLSVRWYLGSTIGLLTLLQPVLTDLEQCI